MRAMHCSLFPVDFDQHCLELSTHRLILFEISFADFFVLLLAFYLAVCFFLKHVPDSLFKFCNLIVLFRTDLVQRCQLI
jgi:hypothetical protein